MESNKVLSYAVDLEQYLQEIDKSYYKFPVAKTRYLVNDNSDCITQLDSLLTNAEYIMCKLVGLVKNSKKAKDAINYHHFLSNLDNEQWLTFRDKPSNFEDCHFSWEIPPLQTLYLDKSIPQSIEKFFTQFEAFIGNEKNFMQRSVDDKKAYEVMTEQFLELSNFCSFKKKYQPLGLKKVLIRFIDGFWGEGKTEMMETSMKDYRCSEFDSFFRIILSNGKPLPNKYFRIGVLFGMVVDVFYWLKMRSPTSELPVVFHRSPMSHWFFDSMDNMRKTILHISIEHYVSLVSVFAHSIFTHIDFEILIPDYDSLSLPWPIVKHRTLEKRIYTSENFLKDCFANAYNQFYQFLQYPNMLRFKWHNIVKPKYLFECRNLLPFQQWSEGLTQKNPLAPNYFQQRILNYGTDFANNKLDVEDKREMLEKTIVDFEEQVTYPELVDLKTGFLQLVDRINDSNASVKDFDKLLKDSKFTPEVLQLDSVKRKDFTLSVNKLNEQDIVDLTAVAPDDDDVLFLHSTMTDKRSKKQNNSKKIKK
jgi:hypothetical protein